MKPANEADSEEVYLSSHIVGEPARVVETTDPVAERKTGFLLGYRISLSTDFVEHSSH
jgi:hypothetical protein